MDMTNKHYLLVVVVGCVRALSSLFLLKTLMRLWHNVIVTSTFHKCDWLCDIQFYILPILFQNQSGSLFLILDSQCQCICIVLRNWQNTYDIWIDCICLQAFDVCITKICIYITLFEGVQSCSIIQLHKYLL